MLFFQLLKKRVDLKKILIKQRVAGNSIALTQVVGQGSGAFDSPVRQVPS